MVFDAVSNHKKGMLSTERFRIHIQKHQAIYKKPLFADTGTTQRRPTRFH